MIVKFKHRIVLVSTLLFLLYVGGAKTKQQEFSSEHDSLTQTVGRLTSDLTNLQMAFAELNRTLQTFIEEIVSKKTSFFGDGSYGSFLSGPTTVVINDYAKVIGKAEKGSKHFAVDSIASLSSGVEVLIIQMKGKEAGKYIFARIFSVDRAEQIVYVTTGLSFRCSSLGSERCQIVTVPHYSNVYVNSGGTIMGSEWDGDKGGVVVLRANIKVEVATSSSKISACGIGYRGGADGQKLKHPGLQGESYNGTVVAAIHSNYGGGGGGMVSPGSCCIGGGGGGAGHRSKGETPSTHNHGGVQPAHGGQAYGNWVSLLDQMLMGSGGGGGARDQDCCANPGRGGNGGGIVMVFTPFIAGSGGIVTACGENGLNAGNNGKSGGEQGGGGGGAGGSVLVVSNPSGVSTKGSVSVQAPGGAGGSSSESSYAAPGGAGSEGIISLHSATA